MRSFICAALCAASFAVSAQVAVYQDDNVQVRLRNAPCEVPAIAQMLQPHQSRQASVIFGGREIPACYAVVGADVVLVDSDGDSGFIPAAAFKIEPGV